MSKKAEPEAAQPTTMKEMIMKIGYSASETNKFLAYINGERQKEATAKSKKPDASTPVTNNSDAQLISLANKFWNLGLSIDGVNVVITGIAMAMVTYHGYKNKVLQTYPTAKFDVQLVREGDEFKVSKKDGKVKYTHEFGDPFDDSKIRGAYCVIKIDDQDFFEALNRRDYDEMKNASKQKYLWDKWESEFVLKSVIKRACKRHFNDIVAEIDKVDNDDYGVADDQPRPSKSEDSKASAAERSRRAIEKAQEIANADS